MRWIWMAMLLVVACGGGEPKAEESAGAAMSAGNYGVAMDKASEGIERAKTQGDRAVVWRLEMIVMESMARSGQGALVVAELERLSQEYAKQVNAKLYLGLGSHAKAAGDTNGAIELWAAGDKKYPSESAQFKREIDALQAAGSLDPAELEKLKTLGYIQ